MWEILVVGGQTPDGRDASNELSYLCLDAAADLQTTQPVLAVRVFEGTPEPLIRKGAEMIQQGMANPGFFNDEAAIKMTLGKGCTMEEARDWTIVGCIQPGPGGGTTDGSPDAGYVNTPLRYLSLFSITVSTRRRAKGLWDLKQEIREISRTFEESRRSS